MKSNYKRLGDYISQIDERNMEDIRYELLGVSVEKCFIKSIANTVGTDWRGYKKIHRGQFCYISDTSRRGDKIGVALQNEYEIALVSQAYTVFEISNKKVLLPEYLNLWFKRPEFDRYARFHSHGSVREIFDWDEMCNVELPVPPIAKQQKIVDAYNTIEKRISLKKKINDNLEAQAQTIYKNYVALADDFTSYVLTDLFDIKYGKGLATSELLKSGYYVFGSNGLIGYYSSYMYENEQITISCRGASSGKVNITLPKCFITSNSLVLECRNPDYYEVLKSFCKSFSFDEYVTGSAQPQLTIDSLIGITVELPELTKSGCVCKALASISKTVQHNMIEIITLTEKLDMLLNIIMLR